MFTALLRRTLATRLLSLGLMGAAVAVFTAPQAAAAQSAGTRIAVVNAQKVYNDMQETKAMTNRMAEENKRLQAESDSRAQALQKLKRERDEGGYKPGSPQFNEINKRLIQQSAEFKTWAETQRALMEDAYKQQVRQLFDKVQSAIADVAKREGYDIVFTDTSERLPDALDQVDLRALKAMLLQKSVLYASEKSDITNMVIVVLDAKYKAAADGK